MAACGAFGLRQTRRDLTRFDLDFDVLRLQLTAQEKSDLVAFMLAL